MFRYIVAPLVVSLLLPSAVAARELPEIAHRLPSGEEWLVHAMRDLVPYWSSPEALGEPIGQFPTYRYADGTPIEGDELLRPEYSWIAEHAPWLGLRLDRTYTRMISRQAYVLAMAFHMTGDGRYLAWAKAAVDHILDDLADGEGSFCSWVVRGSCAPAPPRRTAQDLSYALLGPAAYAYVTRDPDTLRAVAEAHRAFFDAYRDAETGLVRWVLEASEDPPDTFSPEQVELVAQLDPINAYLLVLEPLVPAPDAEAWRADLVSLAKLLRKRFYSAEHNVFWGRIDAAEYRRLAGHHHTDTGHTAKSFWMLGLVARRTGDGSTERWAREGGRRLLDAVFLEESGSWAGGWGEDGVVAGEASWWAHAELDQLAATLALADPSAARHLPRTYEHWLTRFVDHHHGGTWASPVEPTEQPAGLKAFLWKNGYHSMEHALVAYIAANALRGEGVSLYFAPAEGTEPAVWRPYCFEGHPEIVRRLPLPQLEGHDRLEIRFSEIR